MTKIDDIDRRILRNLQANARLTNIQLAERIGLSPSACLRRVQELERQGVIKGYHARLDGAQTGRGFVTFVAVALSDHSKASQDGFERAMALFDEVAECHNVAGAFEYLLRVETADLAEFKLFHTEKLGTVSHVRSITSYMVMGTPKDNR